LELFTHEVPQGVKAFIGTRFAQLQGLRMRGGIVLAGQQPLWIDGERARQCGHDIDESINVDRALAVFEQTVKCLGRDPKDRRDFIELAARLSRDHRAQAVSNGFDEWIVDRQRQGDGLRLRDGGKIAFRTANRMLALR
jgi:hypothetical protein